MVNHSITDIAIAGGVSANSELRKSLETLGKKHKCSVHIPDFEFCTDNAAMIAEQTMIRGYNVSARVHCYIFGNQIGT